MTTSTDDMASLEGIKRRLGVTPANEGLLKQALVHRSYLNENPQSPLASNERLEFIGDSVLGLVVTEELFRRFPEEPEGELTHLRASLVRGATLARWATQLGLGEQLLMGKGEEASGGRQRPANLANVMEAILGAAYLDHGLEAVRGIVLPLLEGEVTQGWPSSLEKDPKSRLQDLTQANWQVAPNYRTVDTEGPEHHRQFTVEVMVGERVMGQGTAPSKRQAQQAAASVALEALTSEGEAPPPPPTR
ncbi:MAG: ribonuclease III [Dehalococcoidia bacterium]|nr:ribonuclease III [Dehalococcoidia bacterium]